ncbi:hypothetical protein AOQ84DRAFT_383381 [Glonium stellatum]|uniref:Uncharacterized protein n=1 Tax=Glonium stellatum TaxID=574774 RepID=A0A8E2JLR9_9PEZI|nr:hypothetical protein AOQ84DRAFT_383381 [Glonium stellatum]
MTFVLKGLTLDSTKDLFEKKVSHGSYVNCNMEATKQSILELESLESLSNSELLDWARQMLIHSHHPRANQSSKWMETVEPPYIEPMWTLYIYFHRGSAALRSRPSLVRTKG